VPCGGHAWSRDGLSWSNLTIGAFGPVIRFTNGSYWYNAYVERPQVVLGSDGTPLAFFVGMGRSSYVDSCGWAQRFCQPGQTGCGPTIPPSPVNVRYQWKDGRCLITNGTGFPCPGGHADSCPLTLGSCDDPTAVWVESPAGTLTNADPALSACINLDCDECAVGTVAKALSCASSPGNQFSFNNNTGTLSFQLCGAGAMCLNDGSGVPVPPCEAGEFFLPTQVKLSPCGGPDTAGWQRVVVPPSS